MALGQFPKAYAFDPADLIDAEAITKLLEMVETLASSVHLCLIGVGEKYIRWRFERSHADRQSSGPQSSEDAFELDRQLEEYHGKLNAVAMFFLKKSFSNISILDGGFMAAVESLQRPESTFNIQSALVEVLDRAALEAVLGMKPKEASRRGSVVSSLGELFTRGAVNGKRSSSSAPAGVNDAQIPSVARSTSASDLSDESSSHLYPRMSKDATNSSHLFGTWTKSWSSFVPSSSESAISNSSSDTSSTPSKASEGSVKSSGEFLHSWGMKWSSLGSISTNKSRGNTDVAPSLSAVVDSQNQLGEKLEKTESSDRLVHARIADTTTIGIVKTEKEKEQALALHKMAGLRKGDLVTINRQELPGAVLFPSIKYKEVSVTAAPAPDSEAGSTASLGGDISSATATKQLQLHRYLVVSRERFLVLDSSGGGVGSRAVVKSNRHLSEVSSWHLCVSPYVE